MKALIIACLAAVALAAGFHSVENKSTAVVHSNDISPVYHASKALIIRADEDPDVIYHKATCKGQKLLSATTSPRNVAANYIQPIDSPWIGPLVQSLATWGYSIETDDGTPQWRANHFDECELATSHRLRPMCDALGIDTRSSYQGGANQCYYIYHKNGPAVLRDAWGRLPPVNQQYYNANGYQYRVTNAEFTIGVNVPSAILIMTNRQSPATSAKQLWGLSTLPHNNLLPALRSSSDIMWGLWSMASGGWVQRINRFLITPIVNDDTVSIIETILEKYNLDINGLPGWPGLEYTTNHEEYKPLLGSPNVQAVGYFLAQHKRELGGKYISKINVFKADTNAAVAVCMLLTVGNMPSAAQAETNSESDGVERLAEPVVVKRSEDGMSVIREHVVWSRL